MVVVAQTTQEKLQIVTLGSDTRVIIAPMCKEPIPGVWFVHVHEDENTSVQAATECIDSLGKGCFVTLKHGMGRNISFSIDNFKFTFDPNRIYSENGRKATLNRFGNLSDSSLFAVAHLANVFTSTYIDSSRLVVALHNNTNDGGLTIQAYQKGGAFEADAAQVFINPAQDPDDFYYTTSERAFTYFKNLGFNVLLQNNETATDDGSLSVYAGEKGIDYINIEAQHGKKDQQKKMLLATMGYIHSYYSTQ